MSDNSFPLKNVVIALAISGTPDQEGSDGQTLMDVTAGLVRALLKKGASLAYGGDLREGGYTRMFFDLLAEHKKAHPNNQQVIHNVLAWPAFNDLSDQEEKRLKGDVVFHRVSPPRGVPKPPPFVKLDFDSMLVRFAQSMALEGMRKKLHELADAYIFMGGRVQGFRGMYPGLLAEIVPPMKSGKPLFVLGGFGGAAASIVSALRGGEPAEFTDSFQEKTPGYARFRKHFMAQMEKRKDSMPEGFGGMVGMLRKSGMGGLKNQMGDLNEKLFTSTDPEEIASMIAEGMEKVFGGRA